ncbi:hypothetical protein BJV77DRAFT_1160147 [Russula vinacea]|nr:hypothetical protein BJV77DRAFT_1160147 [Russula vinacea]
MDFNPLSLLILKFRGSSVAVFRTNVSIMIIVAVARRNLRSLKPFVDDDLVLLASIPGYPDKSEVELPTKSGQMQPDSAESDCGSSTVASLRSNKRPAIERPIPVVSTLSSRFSGRTVRKPVIYLYPPSRLQDVIVELFLTSSWSFSAVYPSPQTASVPSDENRIGTQSLTWAIEAEPDGKLVEKTTGVEGPTCTGKQHASRESTPVEDIEAFDPSRPSLSPGDSILLPIGKIPGYLDVALKALTLHTRLHEYVALRFVAQASYEKAAQMRISPAPDVVTRIFMLFHGVPTDDVNLWAPAAARASAEDGATFWTKVVGVDAVRASDRTLFRVLEWGGMEVV